MEILELFSGFDLNNVKDSDLQTVAKGLAVTLVTKPLKEESPADLNQAAVLVSNTLNRYLHKVIEGNALTKAGMIATVTMNLRKAPKEQLKIVSLDTAPMLELVSDMHIHHLQPADYQAISDEFARLVTETGEFPILFHPGALAEDAICTDTANKIYTALKMALNDKDALLEKAQGTPSI